MDAQPRDVRTAPVDGPEPTPPKPPRPRWGRRLLLALTGVVLLLAALVGLLPTIVSQPAVSRLALGFVNDRIRGRLAIERLDAGWLSPISIGGLTLHDPDGREVLEVEAVSTARGLWGALTGGASFEEVALDSPRVALHVRPDGSLSIASALKSRRPATKSSGDGELPELVGRVVLRDGRIDVQRDGLPGYAISDIAAELSMRTLSTLRGTLSMRLPDGNDLSGEWNVDQLVRNGRIDPHHAIGSIRFSTPRPVEIGALADVLLGRRGLTGRATMKVSAELKTGDVSASAELAVNGFRDTAAPSAGQAAAEPLDLTAKLDAALRAARVEAAAELSGTPGAIEITLATDAGHNSNWPTGEQLMTAMLGGREIVLPWFELKGRGRLDLAAFDRAAPGLLPMPSGSSLAGGRVELASLAVTGGDSPGVAASVGVSDVTMREGGRVSRLSAAKADIEGRLEPGVGLKVNRGAIDLGFARLSVTGTPVELSARFETDLAALRRDAGRIVDFGDVQLSGSAQGQLDLRRDGPDRVNTRLEINARQLRCVTGGQPVEIEQAALRQTGHVQLGDDRVRRLEAAEMSADLGGQVVVSGKGWFDVATGALQVAAELTRCSLADLSRQLATVGVELPKQLVGDLGGQLALARAGNAAPFTSSGRLTARAVRVGTRPVLDPQADLSWDGAEFGAADRPIALASAELKAAFANITAEGFRFDPRGATPSGGKIRGAARLDGLLGAVSAIGGADRPPALSGETRFDVDLRQIGKAVQIAGSGEISSLEIGAGEQSVREPRIEISLDATVDAGSRRITLGRNRVASRLLTAEVSGTIDRYDAEAQAALAGRYETSWKELTALLHELVPATAEFVELNCASQSDFRLSGPLNQPGATPAFRGVAAETGLGWQSARLVGVGLGPATLRPRLADGLLTLPAAQIDAAGGRVVLAGELDFRGADPRAADGDLTLRLPGALTILDQVKISPQLGRELLGRINPIFYHVASADGLVHLDTKDVVLPFGPSRDRLSRGAGRLELENMRIRPSGIFTELLTLGNRAAGRDLLDVVVKGCDFTIEKGRIHYKDFTLIFPDGFDLMFYGSVGFDDTLDLVVSLPIREGLLARLGLRGEAAEYARILATTRLDVPMVGTRQKPNLDFSRVDKKALIDRVVRESAKKGLGDVLRGIGGRPRGEEGAPEPPAEPPPEPQRPRRRR